MDLEVQFSGRAARRGVIPRPRPPTGLGSEVEAWLHGEQAEFVRSIRRAAEGDDAILHVELHPAGPELRIRMGAEGAVSVSGRSAPVGPGYHTYLCQLMRELGEGVDIDWSPADDAAAGGSPPIDGQMDGPGLPHGSGGSGKSGPEGRIRGRLRRHQDGPHVGTADPFADCGRPAIERAHLAWLGAVLTRVREGHAPGQPALHLGTPSGVRYSADGALLTYLGPRDDAWVEAAIRSPRTAIDVWPWFADVTDGRYLLNRALCLMWTEVRWRAPVGQDEIAVQDEVLHLLRRAYPLDPSLPYPWPEWRELLQLRGEADPMTDRVGEQARAAAGTERPPVGYRRRPVTITHEGWALEVPGSWSERRTAEEWTGGEAGRSITLAAVETADEGRPMAPHVFLARFAADLGPDTLDHHEGPVVGRARISVGDESGVELGTLEGYSAVLGRGAAVHIEFHDPADWQWALDTWRALRPAGEVGP